MSSIYQGLPQAMITARDIFRVRLDLDVLFQFQVQNQTAIDLSDGLHAKDANSITSATLIDSSNLIAQSARIFGQASLSGTQNRLLSLGDEFAGREIRSGA